MSSARVSKMNPDHDMSLLFTSRLAKRHQSSARCPMNFLTMHHERGLARHG
jgi:hypothetical protein